MTITTDQIKHWFFYGKIPVINKLFFLIFFCLRMINFMVRGLIFNKFRKEAVLEYH